jgi:P27 family predicted phage terminase small subunit
MKRGPKPKPTTLKILEGAQKCRINFDEPKVPAATDLSPPDWLDRHGRDHWEELAPVLSRARLLSEADRHALAMLCDDYSTIRNSMDGTDEAASEYKRVVSSLANADKARDRYRRMLLEFGMTPSSRSRIKAPADGPRDDLESFLEKKA